MHDVGLGIIIIICIIGILYIIRDGISDYSEKK